jgi:hypothetical protein
MFSLYLACLIPVPDPPPPNPHAGGLVLLLLLSCVVLRAIPSHSLSVRFNLFYLLFPDSFLSSFTCYASFFVYHIVIRFLSYTSIL